MAGEGGRWPEKVGDGRGRWKIAEKWKIAGKVEGSQGRER